MKVSQLKEKIIWCVNLKSLYMDINKLQYIKFNNTIKSFGFQENIVDRCIYQELNGSKFIFLIVYVVNILFAKNDLGILHQAKVFLSNNSEMKDMRETFYVIEIEIFHDKSQGLLGLSSLS